jgi:hypothetical protein
VRLGQKDAENKVESMGRIWPGLGVGRMKTMLQVPAKESEKGI